LVDLLDGQIFDGNRIAAAGFMGSSGRRNAKAKLDKLSWASAQASTSAVSRSGSFTALIASRAEVGRRIVWFGLFLVKSGTPHHPTTSMPNSSAFCSPTI
jgi:hypothetical protein